jgi:hypothetical protein
MHGAMYTDAETAPHSSTASVVRAQNHLTHRSSQRLCIPCTFTKSAPLKDHHGVDLVSNALPFGRLLYGEPKAIENAISYAKFYSRSHDAVIRVCDSEGNVMETHEHAGDFKEW